MATLTIRKLSDDAKRKLRVRAAENGHSMEEEARKIIEAAVTPKKTTRRNLAEEIHRIVAPMGGIELDLPPRGFVREPPDFSGPEYDP
jgi:plasmid stability protein